MEAKSNANRGNNRFSYAPRHGHTRVVPEWLPRDGDGGGGKQEAGDFKKLYGVTAGRRRVITGKANDLCSSPRAVSALSARDVRLVANVKVRPAAAARHALTGSSSPVAAAAAAAGRTRPPGARSDAASPRRSVRPPPAIARIDHRASTPTRSAATGQLYDDDVYA